MNFEQFWKDPRIPKRMKRCGPQPVRAALSKVPEESWEGILQSLSGYEKNKPDYADYCHLSTYINQERYLVEWDEMDDEERVNGVRISDMTYEQRRELRPKLRMVE